MDMQTIVVHKVRYTEFERFIRSQFAQDYDFVADQGCGNDSDHEFSTDHLEWFDKYDREYVETFIKTGKGRFLAQNLLYYCVEKGLIPSGTYLISVSW